MRRAFTLIEVNLAIMVMAVGVLGLISLYSLGYRESQQSNEDVEAAALAERNMNALVTALSSTNMSWSAWNQIGTLPGGSGSSSGWAAYLDQQKFRQGTIGVSGDPNGKARQVFNSVMGKCSGCEGSDVSFETGGGDFKCGLVVHQSGGRCAISFRSGRRAGTMLFQPIYFTEVFFQGDPTK